MQNSEFTVKNNYTYVRSGYKRWLLSHIMRYPYLPIIALLSGIISAFANGYIQVVVGNSFDVIIDINADQKVLLKMVLFIVFLAVSECVLTFINNSVLQITGQTMERDIKEEYFVSLLGKSQKFFSEHTSGDILAHATNDVAAINTMFSPGILLISEAVMAIIAPIFLIGNLKLQLLIVPLLYLVIWYITVYRYNKKLNDVSGKLNYKYSDLSALATEAVSNIELVKGFSQEKRETKKFVQEAVNYKDYYIEQGKIQGKFIPNLVYTICLALAFLHGVILCINNVISIGELITFFGLFYSFEHANNLSAYAFLLFQLGMVGSERILKIINTSTELDENEDGLKQKMKGHIKFDHVSFKINEKEILKNINLEIEQGQTVAIVGRTGSGKTIMTQLINRIYEVSQGKITIDGMDVQSWNLEYLRQQISYIEQNVFLFSCSIADNISFSKKGATMKEIQEAARKTYADDFIQKLEDKYHTLLGEGTSLSGGERQRIAIARALLTESKVIILDDFTSAVDSETEDAIYKTIKELGSEYTIIIITNKVNQVKHVDQIFVLKHGNLVGAGVHSLLIETCDEYQKMFFTKNKI